MQFRVQIDYITYFFVFMALGGFFVFVVNNLDRAQW